MYDKSVQMISIVGLGIIVIFGAPLAQARVRQLDPSAFRELPADVVAELQRRNCKIPQFDKHMRSNVVQGRFFDSERTDWAVLCLLKKRTSLLVFLGGQGENIAEIDTRPNNFSTWSIRPINPQALMSLGWNGSKPALLEHQGIMSGVEYGEPTPGHIYDYSAEEKVFYYYRGKWLEAGTTIVN